VAGNPNKQQTMKTLFLTIIAVAVMEFAAAQTISKDVVATAGDTYTNTSENIVLSWTIGQTVTGTFYSGDGTFSISQGFHTGMPLSGIGIEEYYSNSPVQNIYPNPTHGNAYLEMTNSQEGPIIFKIYNAQGKLVSTQQEIIENEKIEIQLQSLKPGIYFISSLFEDGNKKSQKIIKQ